MSIATRTEQVVVEGGSMPAHLAAPEGGRGPGLLLLQEIFGVNDYITGRAATLAGMGYTVLAPDLYWRMEPGIALPHDADSLERAFGYVQRLDEPRAIEDAGAAFRHLRALAECDGRAGVIGFCLGGRIGYHVAALVGPDAAVLYYGSGIADRLDLAPRLRCPTLMHFGADDPYIPPEAVERIQAAFGGREEVEIAVQPDAQHTFDNYLAPMFHRPAAALAAWQLTEEFLARCLPVRTQAAGK
jgi:carboxymethylenebutenolidase